MRYANAKCDGCEGNFHEGDDIVVCPECGTPQHRSCYEKENRCVNFEKHGEGFTWQGEAKDNNAAFSTLSSESSDESDLLICPQCGEKNERGAERCAKCGTKFVLFGVNILEKERALTELQQLREEGNENVIVDEQQAIEQVISLQASIVAPDMLPEQEQEQVASHPIKWVMAFVGNNALKYINKFRAFAAGKKLSWNWAAFFLTPYWFFYRRLYKVGTLVMTLQVALATWFSPVAVKVLEAYENLSLVASNPNSGEQGIIDAMERVLVYAPQIYSYIFLTLLIMALSGLFADRLYKSYVEKSLGEIRQSKTYVEFNSIYWKYSGTSIFPVLLASLARSVIVMALSYFLG